MNRSELIASVAEQTRLSQADAASAVTTVLETIMSVVAAGDSVAISGFGTFDRRERAARTGRNPRTGAPLAIAAAHAPGFKAGAEFKTRVRG
jgi:DNA-binding protein HU-beta